jgi:hypothetical protein
MLYCSELLRITGREFKSFVCTDNLRILQECNSVPQTPPIVFGIQRFTEIFDQSNFLLLNLQEFPADGISEVEERQEI